MTGASGEPVAAPVYFMTEDDISRGSTQVGLVGARPYESVAAPSRVESVIATVPTGGGGAPELWKLNHYYERLDDWNESQGLARNPFLPPAADPVFELHNLTTDPEERRNVADAEPETRRSLVAVIEAERDAKRRLPAHRNPTG